MNTHRIVVYSDAEKLYSGRSRNALEVQKAFDDGYMEIYRWDNGTLSEMAQDGTWALVEEWE